MHPRSFRGAANPAVQVDREGRYLDANEAALAFWQRTLAMQATALDTSPRVSGVRDSRVRVREQSRDGGGPERGAHGPHGHRRDRPVGWRNRTPSSASAPTSPHTSSWRTAAGQQHGSAGRASAGQRRQAEVEKRVTANLELLITPMLDRLERQLRSQPESDLVEGLGRISPNPPALRGAPVVARRRLLSTDSPGARGRWLRACGQDDRPDRRDHAALALSRGFHRGNIRRKLGLKRGVINSVRCSRLAWPRMRSGPPTTIRRRGRCRTDSNHRTARI